MPDRYLTLGAHGAQGVITVLTLCVCVCPLFSGSIKHLYNTLIMAIGFVLNIKGFQLTDFSEKASFESYSLFARFTTWRPFYFVDMLTQHIDARFCMHTARAYYMYMYKTVTVCCIYIYACAF